MKKNCLPRSICSRRLIPANKFLLPGLLLALSGCGGGLDAGRFSAQGVWELQSDDEKHFKVLIYFGECDYAYIRQDFRRDLAKPDGKYAYRIVYRDQGVYVRTEAALEEPEFGVRRDGTEVYLEQRTPRSFLMPDKVTRYRRISHGKADGLLRRWTVSEIDFEKLPLN
jgi:hypothetical protein